MGKRLTPRKSDGKYMIQVLLPHAQGDFYVKYIEEKLKLKVNKIRFHFLIEQVLKKLSEVQHLL